MGIGDGEPAGPGESQNQEAPHRKDQEDVKGADRADAVVQKTSTLDHERRPPLPPRPTNLSLLQETTPSSQRVPQRPRAASRPQLSSTATTAVSRTDINTQSYQDGSRETFAATAQTPPQGKSPRNYGSIRMEKFKGHSGSEGGDTASVRSYAPTLETGEDAESLFGNILGGEQENSAWRLFADHPEGPSQSNEASDEDIEMMDFHREFDEIPAASPDGARDEQLLSQWRSKRKHFLILSSAGKPIYSRHGDDNLISSTMGTIQTLISFYEGAKDQLRSFTAADTRFVIMSQGPLYLVAISKLAENESQLRAQLEALYMQILSTLTLPTLTTIFSNRPNTDLRRPLKGTEVLLSALADTFTRGSPPALLSALECLKMKKTQRKLIDDTLLRTRSPDLLYGLIVAGGRLVSVVRPRKHSLHAGDLQLIFNMLFEADGVKAGGGENWIPLCLPGFNKNGYLYMYVSFLSATSDETSTQTPSETPEESSSRDEIAILLISANKESFFSLRKTRDTVVAELDQNGSMSLIKAAVRAGRPLATDIIPGTVLRHFLYKSKANVQFVMPSYEPDFTTLLTHRRLLSTYHKLHASVHAKMAHLKVHHGVSREAVTLAWVTPLFELYCVGGPRASRNALAQSANKIVQWARREEERIFIIGGGVF